MRNLPEWSVAFWAAALAGAIVTPLNAWWTGPELEYGLADSGTTIAIVDAERWERLREHVDNCPRLEAHLRQPLERGDRRSARAAARRRDRRAERLGGACRRRRCRTSRSTPDDDVDDLLHLGHDREAEGRGHHPSQHHLERLQRAAPRRRARSCGAARRRRRPIRRAAEGDPDLGAVLPRHRLLRGDDPGAARRAASS